MALLHSRPLWPDPIAAPAPTPSQVLEMDGWRSLFIWPWPPTTHPTRHPVLTTAKVGEEQAATSMLLIQTLT